MSECSWVRERVEVVEWNKRWPTPFPCCPVYVKENPDRKKDKSLAETISITPRHLIKLYSASPGWKSHFFPAFYKHGRMQNSLKLELMGQILRVRKSTK